MMDVPRESHVHEKEADKKQQQKNKEDREEDEERKREGKIVLKETRNCIQGERLRWSEAAAMQTNEQQEKRECHGQQSCE